MLDHSWELSLIQERSYGSTYMYLFQGTQDILGKIQKKTDDSKVYALEFCNPEIIFRQLLDEFRVYIFRAKE